MAKPSTLTTSPAMPQANSPPATIPYAPASTSPVENSPPSPESSPSPEKDATTKTVICRSKRYHTTKRNFGIFKAPDFIAAALLHIPL